VTDPDDEGVVPVDTDLDTGGADLRARPGIPSPVVFAVVVAVIVIWAASFPLWKSTTKWELAIHTVGGVLSLLLLVLLENAGRRNTEAIQEKLNVIAEAMAAYMESQLEDDDHEMRETIDNLREAVGLEERH
jgi:low affinity Fe/Cu permease